MTARVLDASAILAAILGEPGGDHIFEQLDDARVCTVNVAEVYSYAAVKSCSTAAIDAFFADTGIEIVALDPGRARLCGQITAVTRKAGLSLGDRACLSLAITQNAKVLTADRAWQTVAADLKLEVSLIR